VAQSVGADSFGDPSSVGDAAHDAGRGVTFESAVVVAAEDGSLAAFPDCEVDGARGAGREWILPPLRTMVRVR